MSKVIRIESVLDGAGAVTVEEQASEFRAAMKACWEYAGSIPKIDVVPVEQWVIDLIDEILEEERGG